MNSHKVVKKAAGGIFGSAGYVLKLAERNLSVAEIVLNGARNMADSFVKAPEFGVGKAAFDMTQKSASTLAKKFMKYSKRIAR